MHDIAKTVRDGWSGAPFRTWRYILHDCLTEIGTIYGILRYFHTAETFVELGSRDPKIFPVPITRSRVAARFIHLVISFCLYFSSSALPRSARQPISTPKPTPPYLGRPWKDSVRTSRPSSTCWQDGPTLRDRRSKKLSRRSTER